MLLSVLVAGCAAMKQAERIDYNHYNRKACQQMASRGEIAPAERQKCRLGHPFTRKYSTTDAAAETLPRSN